MRNNKISSENKDVLVPPELSDRLDYILCKVAERVKKEVTEKSKKKGFKSSYHCVLRALISAEDLSQHELAVKLKVDPSTVVDLVDQLESDGFVVRARKPTDRRVYLIRITSEGSKELERSDEMMKEIQDELFGELEHGQAEALRDALQCLAGSPASSKLTQTGSSTV